MPKHNQYRIGIEIGRLTNSILNTISGDSFDTEVALINKTDLKNISTRNGWKFNWKAEFKLRDRKVYKLSISNNPNIIQGLASISDAADHFYLHLIESAPFNMGRRKLYEGVPGNLFAFACKSSWEAGYEGFVSFTAKTRLISHYQTSLGATHIGGQKMIIYPDASIKLVKQYFKK